LESECLIHTTNRSVASNYRCGYCGVDEAAVGAELTVDHYQPRSAGGSDDLENLIYACIKCNQYKGDYWPSAEEETSGHYVFHPHRHLLSLHLRENEITGELEPLTDTGAFHIRLLHLNRPPLVAHRLARRATNILRQRILLLQEQIEQREQTIQQLQEYISLLTALIATISRHNQ